CGPAKNDPTGPAVAATEASNTDTTGPAPGPSPVTMNSRLGWLVTSGASETDTPPRNAGSPAKKFCTTSWVRRSISVTPRPPGPRGSPPPHPPPGPPPPPTTPRRGTVPATPAGGTAPAPWWPWTPPGPGPPPPPAPASTSITPSPLTSAGAVRPPPVNDGSNA